MQKFIGESAIFQEAEILKSTPTKAIFKMVLQTANDVNQNKRMYPRRVLDKSMKDAEPRIKGRKFGGELDHPLISQGNSEAYDGMRQTTFMLKEASHLIRDYEWQGNKLIGELETLTTPNGKIVLSLLQDRFGLGLSMRGLASLEQENGVNVVQDPLFLVAYDHVSLPSHISSVVNFNEMRFENKNFLIESSICQSENLICANGICFLPDYFDKLVESKTLKFFERWV